MSEKMIAREHAKISFVGDGLQEAKEALVDATKRAAEAKGICVDSVSIEPSRKTVQIYERMSTFYDRNITRVNRDKARLKSPNREVMSRSDDHS